MYGHVFARVRLTGRNETDLEFDGTVHFTRGRPRGRERELVRASVCVLCVSESKCVGSSGSPNETEFSQQPGCRSTNSDQQLGALIPRYGVPQGPNFGSHHGAIFRAYHSLFITV